VNNVVAGAQHTLNFTILRSGVWTGHPELHAVRKEELPQGGVVELAHIVALDVLDLAVELSTGKREELGDSRKGVRFQMQRNSPIVV
jgi:hypothetical protein